MQSFSFKSDYDENRNIERIISERNRRLARQQLIFTLLLVLLLLLLGWYIFRKVVYTEFDGYVQTEYKSYRAMEDLYLFNQYAEVGDIVIPGDTLYSFVYINLFGLGNMNSEPGVITNDRNARVQLNIAYAEANVLRVRIRELENQIAKEDNNIRFGLTDNSHKMDLQRELAEAREQLNATLKKAGVYSSISRESQSAVHRFGQYSLEFANDQAGLDHLLRQIYERNSSAIHYEIAQDTAVVTKLWAPPFSRVFKKEPILQLENVSLKHSNMQVVAYVPTYYMNRVNNNTTAEIIVNDDVKFRATVELLGARTEELPEELRNSLSHTYTSVMVVFSPDPDQTLPLWAAVDHVPVRVRIKNYDNGRRDDGSDYWYITHDGLTETSKYFLGMMRRKSATNPYHYNPMAEENANATMVPASSGTGLSRDLNSESGNLAKGQNAGSVQKPPASKEAAPADKKPATAAEVEHIRHKVEYGQTLYGIAHQYKVPVEDIVALNPGVDKKLYADEIILIPVRK